MWKIEIVVDIQQNVEKNRTKSKNENEVGRGEERIEFVVHIEQNIEIYIKMEMRLAVVGRE